MVTFNDVFSVQGITIVVTEDCNLRCKYCFEEHSKNSISSKNITEIIDKVWTNFLKINDSERPSKLSISIFGGEPLLVFEQLMVLLDHCSLNNYSVSVGITTNLTMLTDKMIEIFDAYQVGLLLQLISILLFHS